LSNIFSSAVAIKIGSSDESSEILPNLFLNADKRAIANSSKRSVGIASIFFNRAYPNSLPN
jgi:hypothetical protein